MVLNQNEFVASLVNIIVKTRINDTTKGRRIYDLIDTALIDAQEYGEGELIISADTLTVEDYNPTSSLLTARKPTVDEQRIETTDKKMIAVTINRYLMKGAFENETAIYDAIVQIEAMLNKTKDIYTYKKIVKAFEGWTPTNNEGQPVNQTTQVVTIDLIDTTGMTGSQLVESNKANALTIYGNVRKYSLNMQAPSRKYNEISFESMYNADDMDFIVNGNFDEFINTYSYASLLNSDKLNNIKLYDKSIIIPEDQFTNSDTKNKTIGWLAEKKKYVIQPRFIVGMSFEDGSNLNLNEFLHLWYNSAMVKSRGMVKFVANFVKPTNK